MRSERPVAEATPLLRNIAARVHALRRERGLTLKALAERSGLSLRFVSAIETGRANISVVSLEKLARALGVGVTALLEASKADERHVIALMGLRGAGKSTIGAALAQKLGVEFHELDRLIEAEAGMSLAELFAVHGEAYYRELELTALKRFFREHTRGVLATGGGVVTSAATFSLLRERARTIWLKAKPEEHWQRVVRQGDLRPMANRPHAMSELRRRLRERAPLYALADETISTSGKTVSAVVSQLSTRAFTG